MKKIIIILESNTDDTDENIRKDIEQGMDYCSNSYKIETIQTSDMEMDIERNIPKEELSCEYCRFNGIREDICALCDNYSQWLKNCADCVYSKILHSFPCENCDVTGNDRLKR